MGYSAPLCRDRRLNIVQGEFHVADDPGLMLTTLLGSCVAACLHAPVARVGGMNHLLLPGDNEESHGINRHGVHAMELLVNGLLQRGAHRERLQAKLFGGARMLKGLTDVGSMNADFAERFIKRERIRLTGGSLRGDRGRRLQFWPVDGRARQMTIAGCDDAVFAAERAQPSVALDQGGVELF